ncbi:unnamed protein product [Pleuronectes platessa]|uniref:Uncharacterized protein n=1 Tax=Pleuronectes platessa TaxID=8262 RepID=A0A9N7W1R6_PLEPL|nr:unnamed protein product [Pleuronectes platessa]
MDQMQPEELIDCRFCFDFDELGWFGHQIRVFLLGTFSWRFNELAQTRRRPRGRGRIHWRDYISHLGWGHLGFPKEEPESLATSCVDGYLCDLSTDKWKLMDGIHSDEASGACPTSFGPTSNNFKDSSWRFTELAQTRRRPRGRARIHWRDYISHLGCGHLGFPKEEPESLATPCLDDYLCDLSTDKWKLMDGIHSDEASGACPTSFGPTSNNFKDSSACGSGRQLERSKGDGGMEESRPVEEVKEGAVCLGPAVAQGDKSDHRLSS